MDITEGMIIARKMGGQKFRVGPYLGNGWFSVTSVPRPLQQIVPRSHLADDRVFENSSWDGIIPTGKLVDTRRKILWA